MSRLQFVPRRALSGLVVAVVIGGLVPVGASAQTPAPEPVIDHAPGKVGFGRPAAIKGRLDGGTPGDEVTLQQRRSGGDWRVAAVKPVDENARVRFDRRDMRKTTTFRLVWTDDVESVETFSEPVEVEVRPRLTLRVRPDDIFAGRRVKLTGRLFPAVKGRRVLLQQKVTGEWRNLGRVGAGDGEIKHGFTARYKGHRKVRAVFRGDAFSTGARVTKPLTIYREDMATWYGPGFYGNRTACGRTLTTDTLGVAHRTLPCGTMVSILYRGRTITVPVIDRGPYSHANWDLTSRTARRLGFSGSNEIGVTR